MTNKREIKTTVLAEDKETIVLGGLIEDDIQDTKKKVPLLGDIPWLGKLFQNDQKQHTKKNLLVFLRPTVLHTRRGGRPTRPTASTRRSGKSSIKSDDQKTHSDAAAAA